MPYQRDSIRGFLKYFGSFVLSGIYKLVSYFKKRNRKKLMYSAIRGEVFFIVLSIVMCLINMPATLCVFVVPYFFYRLIAMLGNWAQHAFIDPSEPENSYKNSITCINSKYNWQCWNDGYHISHHLKQTLHWTEHPRYFRDHVDNYSINNAVVFIKIDFMLVSIFLLAKRYDLLVKNFVNIGGRFKSDDEIMSFLKKRVRKFAFDNENKYLPQ
jgi:fatty acid desaturase